MSDLDEDAAAIRSITQRLATLRSERVLAASRLCSQLESTVRPIGDKHLLKLVDLVQGQLSRLLSDRPAGDG